MRIARVSLGAAARGMTRDDAASSRPGGSDGRVDGQPAGRVYLRTPARSDRAEFVGLMRASLGLPLNSGGYFRAPVRS